MPAGSSICINVCRKKQIKTYRRQGLYGLPRFHHTHPRLQNLKVQFRGDRHRISSASKDKRLETHMYMMPNAKASDGSGARVSDFRWCLCGRQVTSRENMRLSSSKSDQHLTRGMSDKRDIRPPSQHRDRIQSLLEMNISIIIRIIQGCIIRQLKLDNPA